MDNLYSRDVKRFIVVKLRCVFFMRSKVCVHLTHVKLPQDNFDFFSLSPFLLIAFLPKIRNIPLLKIIKNMSIAF